MKMKKKKIGNFPPFCWNARLIDSAQCACVRVYTITKILVIIEYRICASFTICFCFTSGCIIMRLCNTVCADQTIIVALYDLCTDVFLCKCAVRFNLLSLLFLFHYFIYFSFFLLPPSSHNICAMYTCIQLSFHAGSGITGIVSECLFLSMLVFFSFLFPCLLCTHSIGSYLFIQNHNITQQ